MIAATLGANSFEVAGTIRIDFNIDGTERPEALSEQLNFDFDESGGVIVRIQPARHGVIIKKLRA